MKDITSKIVHSLNEAIDTSNPSVENEPEVGVNTPKQVHKCDNCADFYLVSEKANESVCPECGSTGHPYGDVITEEDEADFDSDPAKISNPRLDENDDEDDEEVEELKSEAEVLVDEALKLLDRNDYKRFNEGYRPRSRVTRRGELEMLVESTNGKFVTARRRMTSRQKTAYNLSERYQVNTAKTSANAKKNESIKAHRQELMIKNESRAIKLCACRLLERQGVKYDFKKFNEGMNKFIASRKISESLARINEDDEIGTSELEKMNPDEIGDQVTDVIEDTGLEIVANDVDIDGDTATVNVRVQDSDEVEVHADEIKDVLQDVFDAPVEIVGPYESEGDKTIQDLAVVINPDAEAEPTNEDIDDVCPECGEPMDNCKCNEDDDPMLSSEEDAEKKYESLRRRTRRNESIRRRRSRRRNEAFQIGDGENSKFALVSNMTLGDKNNAPEFLAKDGSLVSGDQPDAEDKAEIFDSFEAAQKFMQDKGIEDDYTPKGITIITNEDIEQNPGEFIEDNNDDKRDLFETEEGSYFEEDDKYFCEACDGTIREVDESEFEDAKATASELDKIQESFRQRNRARARRRRR